MKEDFVLRISRILLTGNMDCLKLDNKRIGQMSQMPINSPDPMYVAAEIFKDTLLEV